MGNSPTPIVRSRWPRTVVLTALTILGLKILGGIVYEYRWYFPPNFVESGFLTRREDSFRGLYAMAFYAHILSGPVTILLAMFLVWSQGRGNWRLWHRWAGRWQMLLIFSVVVPSGLVMSTQALTGPIAGWGFAALSLATGVSAALTWRYAVARRIDRHSLWAMRCFLLLISPLVFRLVAGVLIVSNQESETAYQLNAWLSWLVPLAGYEIWRITLARHTMPSDTTTQQLNRSHLSSESLP